MPIPQASARRSSGEGDARRAMIRRKRRFGSMLWFGCAMLPCLALLASAGARAQEALCEITRSGRGFQGTLFITTPAFGTNHRPFQLREGDPNNAPNAPNKVLTFQQACIQTTCRLARMKCQPSKYQDFMGQIAGVEELGGCRQRLTWLMNNPGKTCQQSD